MAKKLETSVARDFWLGRGRYSKTAMSRTMAHNYNPDKAYSGSPGAGTKDVKEDALHGAAPGPTTIKEE